MLPDWNQVKIRPGSPMSGRRDYCKHRYTLAYTRFSGTPEPWVCPNPWFTGDPDIPGSRVMRCSFSFAFAHIGYPR